MAGPAWFNDNNFWKQKGALTIASGGGQIHGSAGSNADFNAAKIACVHAFYPTTGQFCCAGAALGEMTEPDDPFLGFEPPILRITAGKYEAGAYMGMSDYIGWQGLDTYDLIGGNVNGEANLVVDEGDANWVGPVPPYPDDLQYVRAMIYFRKNFWADGRPVWTGDYWLELYELTDAMSSPDPGQGTPEEPVVCPVRAPWPYRDPVRVISVPDSGRIRRSRP